MRWRAHLPLSGRYGECRRAHRFARAHSSRCGVDLYGSAADKAACALRRPSVAIFGCILDKPLVVGRSHPCVVKEPCRGDLVRADPLARDPQGLLCGENGLVAEHLVG